MDSAWVVNAPAATDGRNDAAPLRGGSQTRYGVIAVLAAALKAYGQSPWGVRSAA